MSKLEVNIPEDMIRTAIEAAVVEKIGAGDPQKFVEAVVKQAIEQKARDGYGRETVFGAACAKMIRQAATEIFEEWLNQNRQALKDALYKHLNSHRQKHLKKMVDDICACHGRIYISSTLKIDE